MAVNGGFFETEDQLLSRIGRVRHIPTFIVSAITSLEPSIDSALWGGGSMQVKGRQGRIPISEGPCERAVTRGATHIISSDTRERRRARTQVQGRYDVVCPMKTAFDLHKAFPEAEFVVCGESGHSANERETLSELVMACDRFGKR